MLQPCGEHTSGRAAHALLKGTSKNPSAPTSERNTHANSCHTKPTGAQKLDEMLHWCFQVSEDVPVSLSFRGKGYAVKVAYGKSVELVLAAAREYFNSSTTLKDSCMGLARWETHKRIHQSHLI